MGCLSVRSAWSNAVGNVVLLLRLPFSSSCVHMSRISPLESDKAFVDEYAGCRWFGASRLPINRGNNRGHNTGMDMHRHRVEGTHRRKAWEHSIHTDRAQYSTPLRVLRRFLKKKLP